MRRWLTLLIILSLVFTFTVGVNITLAQGTWIDTFADDTKIESLVDAVQVTDVTGFGTDFTSFAGNPLLTLESCDPWDAGTDITKQIPGAVHQDVLYFPEGMDGYKFWMVFTPAPEVGSVPVGGSGSPDFWWERATLVRSNDGVNWEKTSDYSNPLVSPGAPGEWDDGWHCDPDFVYAPGEGPGGESWFLYYTGCGTGGVHNGVALSSDGKNYTKYATNPVFPVGYTRCPAVVYDTVTGIFHAWYNWGSYEIGYATSEDGIIWTPYHPTNPGQWGYVVYRATPGTYDQGGISHMDVIYYNGQYWMYYLAMPTAQYSSLVIGLATSPDGINWTQYPEPVMTPGETWTFYQPDWLGGSFTAGVQSLYRPGAVVVDDTMYLYYGGTDDHVAYPAHNYEIGLAISEPVDPDGHIELDRFFEPAEYSSQPDTIAWYHMNEGAFVPTYPGEYAPKDPTLAWYHFNEGQGTTTADSGGIISDDGTLDEPTWTTGLYDNGLSFDGNDRVTVPNSDELNPTEAITIEAWVNPAVDKPNNYVICKMTPGSSDYSYGLKLENTYTGYTEIGAFIMDPSDNMYFAYGGHVPLGTWTHVAMTYEMDALGPTYIRLYQNGTEVTYRYGAHNAATDTIPAGTTIRTNTGPLNIGTIPIPLYYQGTLDEVRLLGIALTTEEIAADGTIPSPTVLDSSGNDNHGYPVGGANWTTGMFDSGMGFDGSTGHVNVPYSESLNTAESLTIEAWVNPAVDKANNYIVCRMTPGSGEYTYGLKLENTYTGYTEIGAFIRDASGNTYFGYGGHVPLGTWTHVAMTYEMDAMGPTHIRLYQNGTEVTYRYGSPGAATDTIPAGTQIRSNTEPLNIGRIPVGTPLYFCGVMDEVRLLAHALSPGEMLADYGAGYISSGSVTSELIMPGSIWDTFYVSDETPEGTDIAYSILNEVGGVLLPSISSGDDISSLCSTPIRLHAQLTTTNPAITPLLLDWSVTSKENQPPVADAGPDQTVEQTSHAGTSVTLDGSGSYDPDGDPLSYLWSASGITFDDDTSLTPTATFPLGTTTVTLVVNDGYLDSDPDTVDITVEDTTPPDISVSISPDTLWPPNHKMVVVTATVIVSDICDSNPSVVLTSIVSNEPDDAKGNGDGSTVNDIQDASLGVADYEFQLRAERASNGDGRTYTITYTATDASGNSATATAEVIVPHDQGKGKK